MDELPPTIALENQPATSPSGQYVLAIIMPDEEKPYELGFTLSRASDDSLIYTSDKLFDNRSVTYFLWDRDDRVWVYSGDIGTYFWQKADLETQWQVSTYATSDVAAPEFLKTVRGKYHPR
ncbi:MAG: hypothetical protein KTR32_18235 [Granulosicoccus sp.]|nr:hypothetical protein [Granulosicoccus sp.]